jgi:hypothetical protein
MYFVYELVDPRCGSVFYVGKGKGNRPEQHEAEARKGKRGRKCDRIRAIIEAGKTPAVNIVERFADELEAYEAEAAHIAKIGLANLTNICIGGIGALHPVDPEKEARKTLRKSAKFIRRAVALYRRGYVGVFYDAKGKEIQSGLFKVTYDMAMSLRERAGHKYFDDLIGAV